MRGHAASCHKRGGAGAAVPQCRRRLSQPEHCICRQTASRGQQPRHQLTSWQGRKASAASRQCSLQRGRREAQMWCRHSHSPRGDTYITACSVLNIASSIAGLALSSYGRSMTLCCHRPVTRYAGIRHPHLTAQKSKRHKPTKS